DYRSADFLSLVDQVHEIITGYEMPDVSDVQELDIYEPLPEVRAGEVVGLAEYLDARGGKEDIFRIAAETRREFGDVIMIVKAAEMLDVVDTPKRAVVLSPEGHRFVKSNS